MIDQFPKLWTGIGCLKNVQVKLHIDTSVPPVAVRHNRVPFHQQQKVAKEIAKLEAADIIECQAQPSACPELSRHQNQRSRMKSGFALT